MVDGGSFRAIIPVSTLCLMMAAWLPAQTTSVLQGTVLDTQGLSIPQAEISVSGPHRAGITTATTDADGSYRLPGLESGVYTLRAAKPGFGSKVYEDLQVTVNRVLTVDIELAVSEAREAIRVSASPSPVDYTASSSGRTITPQQIEDIPLNGRNYLDLMQLVPGVSIHRQRDPGSDGAAPVLGERGGNAVFMVDGMPNGNQVDGGPAAPFDQNSILEFQVLTGGYKAEFGHGSGGVVNVISKSGTGQWHGLASGFYRNDALDSANVSGKSTPFLRRWDIGANLGGPVIQDRVFAFASIERIRESRQLNFNYTSNTPEFLRAREETFNRYSRTYQTRGFVRLDETLKNHRLTQQLNLSNSHITDYAPLSLATALPSARANLDTRHLLLGFRDTATFGDQSNPWLLSAYVQYRREPYSKRPTYPEAGPALTRFNMFSGMTTGGVFGDLGQVQFGAGFTPLQLESKYVSTGAHLNRAIGAHDVKFGWDFQSTRSDGREAGNLGNQLFATVADFAEFGPVESGLYLLGRVGGATPADEMIRLRNNYNGLFVQDDWKVRRNVTLNVGLRWDYDSRFPNRANVSPRFGAAWTPASKTVISASWGMFYDRFRLGLARDVPAFGGANLTRQQTVSLPRLFYGIPTTIPHTNLGFCPSPVLSDREVLSSPAACPAPSMPLLGVDRLNSVVAPGHVPIPPNSVVNIGNVQRLTGLTPQQFANDASAAIGRAAGFFTWGEFGHLTLDLPGTVYNVPITVDPGFQTPFTRALQVGVQREITSSLIVHADYHHRDMRNMLGVRTTNLAFEARLPNRIGQLQPNTGLLPSYSYGPWYQGRYDGVNLGIRQRVNRNFNVEVFYTWADAKDNAYHSSFVSDVQTVLGAVSLATSGPTDSFVGIPPMVRDPVTGQTNETGQFIASNGNPVPQAGKPYNGPDLDFGPSDLAVNHTVVAHGIAALRWFDVSGVFRAQSGFHFSAQALRLADVDGDGNLNGVDFLAGRNRFQAPAYVNVDLRVSRRISIGDKVRAQAMVEFFNLLNRANPAAVQQLQTDQLTPLGTPLQFLPGREGQVGLRFEF